MQHTLPILISQADVFTRIAPTCRRVAEAHLQNAHCARVVRARRRPNALAHIRCVRIQERVRSLMIIRICSYV